MEMDGSILKTIRVSVGLSEDSPDFDTDLIMHINASIATLMQNDVAVPVFVKDDTAVWVDLIDPTKPKGNEYFQLVPLFISLNTKLLFDPPPPSAVDYQANSVNQLLWRLKIAYEDLTIRPQRG